MSSTSTLLHKSTSGKWVTCTATKRACPRGEHRGPTDSDYQELLQEVEAAAEQKAVEAADRATAANTTYSIPTGRLDEALAKIDKANKRLAKYPEITERFTYTLGEPSVENRNGQYISVQALTVNKPVLRVNGWGFAAAHEFTANGGITTFVADEEIQHDLDTRTVDNSCEHCGSNRHRERVYWLRNDDGEVKQVGSNCLKGFLGIKPNGLWALESGLDLDTKNDDDPRSSESRVFDREELLTAALIASDNSNGFVSKTAASVSQPATSEEVRQNWDLYAHVPFDEERHMKVQRILAWIDNKEHNTHGDYMGNLKAALGEGSWVKAKHLPLVVSAISAYDREERIRVEQERKQEADKNLKREYLAPAGAKLQDLRLTVKKSRVFPNQFGHTNLLVLEDEHGHVVKWNSSAEVYQVGDNILVKSATVKDNDIYDDVYQTVITRARTTKI